MRVYGGAVVAILGLLLLATTQAVRVQQLMPAMPAATLVPSTPAQGTPATSDPLGVGTFCSASVLFQVRGVLLESA